jgi:hypothetical protein
LVKRVPVNEYTGKLILRIQKLHEYSSSVFLLADWDKEKFFVER